MGGGGPGVTLAGGRVCSAIRITETVAEGGVSKRNQRINNRSHMVTMLRRVAAFCRPLRPVLLLVSLPRSRSPVVGVLGLC